MCSKLWCTVCSDTFLSWPALTFSAICVTVALLWDQTRWASLRSTRASMSLWCPKLPGSLVGLPWNPFGKASTAAYWEQPTRSPNWRSSDPVIQPSQCFPCWTCLDAYACLFSWFHHINFKNWLVSCLMYYDTYGGWPSNRTINVIHFTCQWFLMLWLTDIYLVFNKCFVVLKSNLIRTLKLTE